MNLQFLFIIIYWSVYQQLMHFVMAPCMVREGAIEIGLDSHVSELSYNLLFFGPFHIFGLEYAGAGQFSYYLNAVIAETQEQKRSDAGAYA